MTIPRYQFRERHRSYWVESTDGPLRGVTGAVTGVRGRWAWECPRCGEGPDDETRGSRERAADALRDHILTVHPDVVETDAHA